MSSIIVRGMDKPESCVKCFFRDGIFCKAKNYKRISYVALDGKIEIWCPLIEVPPHGRLIDIKSVEEGKFVKVSNGFQRWWNGALESVIDNAPTVIEAEGAE